MSVFLGIGLGPIQTGIFVSGAARGGFDRIVLADVDNELVAAVNASGTLTVNTACKDGITGATYSNIEVYNPDTESGRTALIEAGSLATAICTALPSTAFYKHIAPWLREAFAAAPARRRYVYAAENSNSAAAELQAAVGKFPSTYYLDTVIGKMCKVFKANESNLPPLIPGMERGHLVEEFNTIYTSNAPGIESVNIEGLFPKPDLKPFKDAKLFLPQCGLIF